MDIVYGVLGNSEKCRAGARRSREGILDAGVPGRYIRDMNPFRMTVDYIHQNPVN